MASIFDQLGAPPPANAPVGSDAWQDWAGQQDYLKSLKAALPPGTPLDLPEPVLQAIAGGGYPEQDIPNPPDPWRGEPSRDLSSSFEMNVLQQSLMGGIMDAANRSQASLARGGRVYGPLTLAFLTKSRRRKKRGALSYARR